MGSKKNAYRIKVRFHEKKDSKKEEIKKITNTERKIKWDGN